MDFETLVQTRRSIRGYKPDPVPRAVIEEIIGLAKAAPSSMNTQPWHVHVLTGAPLEFFPLDPVSMFISQVGVNPRAPHPNAALMAANFMISREAQQFAAKTGRLPTRDDVEPTPKDAFTRLRAKTVIPILLNGEEARAAAKVYDEIFKKR